MAAPLTELRDALKFPDAHAWPRSDVFESVTPSRQIREAASWLTFAALIELHDGRNAEALADVQALAGFAKLHREEFSLVSEMTRVAAAHIGLNATWQALQAAGWTDSQLASLQHCWEGVDLLEGLERAFVGERAFGLEVYKRFEAGELPQQAIKHGFGAGLYRFSVAPNDFAFRTRNIQERIELVRALQANRPWQQVAHGSDVLDAQLEQKNRGPRRFFYMVSLVSIPNYRPALQRTAQEETKRRLVVTGIALKRYQLQHGHFPDTLDALPPGFVAAVPLDPMSGAPLRYRLNSNQTFTLYSVGEDGRDDGGDPSPVENPALQRQSPKPGAWEGRDTLWPSPTKDAHPQIVITEEGPATPASPVVRR